MTEYIMQVDYDMLNGTFTHKKREEIVRCRDCKHFESTAKNGICHRSKFLPMWSEPNGFCAWAVKRKEVGDD